MSRVRFQDETAEGQGAGPARRRQAIWTSDFFTADLCNSLNLNSLHDFGQCRDAMQGVLEQVLQGELPSHKSRQSTIRVIQALRRSEDIFARYTVYSYWRIRFHISRICDEIAKQLYAAVVGDFFVYPMGGTTERLAVVHHDRPGNFVLAVVSLSLETEFHAWSAETYPKVKQQSFFEVNDVPKSKITSEAFWACVLLCSQNSPLYTTFLPWLNGKCYAEIMQEGRKALEAVPEVGEEGAEADAADAAVAGGVDAAAKSDALHSQEQPVDNAALVDGANARKQRLKRAGYTTCSQTRNVWKHFVHVVKYILRMCTVEEGDISTVRLHIKKRFVDNCLEDLKAGTYKVDNSAKLVIRAAMENAALALTRNGHLLQEATFHAMSAAVLAVKDEIDKVEINDSVTTAPPLIDIENNWEKLLKPELFPLAECLRRLENTDEMVGEQYEATRKLPVNLLRTRPACKSFADALQIIDEVVSICTNISLQQSATDAYMIQSLITHVFTEVIPPPRGPKTRQQWQQVTGKEAAADTVPLTGAFDIFDVTLLYGQQMHFLHRLWQCLEYFCWASFHSTQVPKELDAQRIIVMGIMATISDAVMRIIATDHPSVISQHLNGARRRSIFAVGVGKFAQQTESSIIYNPRLAVARAAVLDYHAEVLVDCPGSNIMWQWEDGTSFCRATSTFLRQVCMAEGFRVDALMKYFDMPHSSSHAVLGKYWSEFRIYRDIYLVFKWMMSPKVKLPSCTRCLSCKISSPVFTSNFERMIFNIEYMHKQVVPKATILRHPSFAVPVRFTTPLDPQTEDDILHIKSLPTFDDTIGQRDSELLLSYLTAPYIRIPLILNFFVSEDRVGCLNQSALCQMLEAVLFEPGKFLPLHLAATVPQQVPSENQNLIATPYGLLFNELQCSPLGVVDPIIKLVALARETDAGTVFNKNVVDIILFLIRIVSRVDAYMDLVLRFASGDLAEQSKLYRDMVFCGDDGIKAIGDARRKLRALIADELIPMLETWNNEIITSLKGTNDIDSATYLASKIHVHILLLIRTFSPSEYSKQVVSMFLSSIVFLNTRYRLGKESEDKPPLLISENEIFDILQQHRRPMVEYLLTRCSPQEVSFVMDSTVRVATSTGRRKKGPAFHWGLVAGDSCLGRFTRVDMGDDSAEDRVCHKANFLARDAAVAFGWQVDAFPKTLTMVDEGRQDVEIDFNFCTLTFKASHLTPISPEMHNNEDVQEVFLPKFEHNHMLLQAMQCASVQHTQERHWVRLVGQEHDIQLWQSVDPRIPLPDSSMRFYPEDVATGVEDWIVTLLEPIRRSFFMRSAWMPPIMMLLPEHKLTSQQNMTVVAAVCSKSGRKLAEIALFRDFQVVHIYKIVNIGRRFYRELVYTSNAYYTLAEMFPSVENRQQPWQKNRRHEAGDFDPNENDENVMGRNSCVILRHPTHPENLSKSTETFLPSRILSGIIPASLLSTHRFWQDPDDNIRGYPIEKKATHLLWVHWKDVHYEQMSALAPVKSTTVEIYRFARAKQAPKVSEKAVLLSQRLMIADAVDEELEGLRTANPGEEDGEDEDGGDGCGMYREPTADFSAKPKESAVVEDYNMKLLNLLNAPKDTPLFTIGQVFARIETLSHVLCWTTNVRYDSGATGSSQLQEPLTIDLISLPRLKLSFSARLDANGVMRIFSLDHAHMFVSNIRSNRITALLQGIPHSIILADVHDAVSILVPALAVVRPVIMTQQYSTEIVVDRNNSSWYEQLDTRYYLYNVHVSFSFLFAPTLASSLYLLGLRFLHFEYDDVFRIASTIGTDMNLTDEEHQNFSLMQAYDERPDAVACRAKISLLLADSPVRMPWYIPQICGLMILKLAQISLSCRLGASEEIRLYHICKTQMSKVTALREKVANINSYEFISKVAKLVNINEYISTRISEVFECLIYNRAAQLEAEEKSLLELNSQPVQGVEMRVPKQVDVPLYQYWRDYAPLKCKVASARKPLKNSEPNGRQVIFSESKNYFYCGASVRKAGSCKCKNCDQDCGPEGGCPCRDCEAFNKENRAKNLYLPTTLNCDNNKFLSFFSAFDWIDTMINMDQSYRTTVKAAEEERRTHEIFMEPQRAGFAVNVNYFTRYYDILTGMVKVRIGSNDTGKDLVQLLFPLTRECCDEGSALGHLMHYMLNNAMTWNKLPKINRTGRQSEENRTNQMFAGIIQQASIGARYPPEAPIIDKAPEKHLTVIVPRANTRKDPFESIVSTRILPQLSNTDCAQRKWLPFNTRMLLIADGEKLDVNDAIREDLRDQPLRSVIPKEMIVFCSRNEQGLPKVDANLPFNLGRHPDASTSAAKAMIQRLEYDMDFYAKKENESKAPKLLSLSCEQEVRKVLRFDQDRVKQLIKQYVALDEALVALRRQDNEFVLSAFDIADRTINSLESSENASAHRGGLDEGGEKSAAEVVVRLRRLAKQEAELNLLYVISCLACSCAEDDWQQLNPFLSRDRCRAVQDLLVTAVLRANRVSHINRSSDALKELIALLKKALATIPHAATQKSGPITASKRDLLQASHEVDDEAHLSHHEKSIVDALVASISQKADAVASTISAKRCYVDKDFTYDPRFLIFEFTWSLVLRGRQREMIEQMYNCAVRDNRSMVQQMIMGAGKTTVVGPLLAMMLANQKNLVIQVVPPALLDFSRSILRGTFSCVVQKQIFCFVCDRNTDVDSEVLSKFLHAKNSRGIVVTTPSSVKSIFLKLIEGLDKVEDPGRRIDENAVYKNNNDLAAVLKLWREDAILIMDEVDTLLHPLKSELNFPIGAKVEIDFAPMRWKLPIHILDAIFYYHSSRVSVLGKESVEALKLLEAIKQSILSGLKNNALQATPHLTLLNHDYYDKHIKMPIAQWLLLFLKSHHCAVLSEADTLEYIMHRPSKDKNARLNDLVMALDPYVIKTLNLSFEWLSSFLPHCLQKIDRVSFGIMNQRDMERAKEEHPQMPRSRFLTSIPFVGKDLPSQSSEFAHPDVVIGLTVLAYRYEGLRRTDYTDIMRSVHAAVDKEAGRFHQRPTNVLYNKWVQSSGGRIVASFAYGKKEDQKSSDDEEDDTLEGEGRQGSTMLTRENTMVAQPSSPKGGKSKSESYFESKPADDDDEEEMGMQPSESLAFIDGENDAGTPNAGKGSKSAAAAKREMQLDLLPLKLMKQANAEESTKVFKLFRRTAEVIHWYLCEHIFPEYMRHQNVKLSASGQELGGNIMFDKRIGFSGTPSDLLPQELGKCEYERGTDGQLIRTLTSTSIMNYEVVNAGWTVRSVLDNIATAFPPYHALIDTGALITGMSNLQVAQYLLKRGLAGIEGVVFLDELDRKMILVRATGRVLTLAECGIPKIKRFAFYDQVHTTGMDIDHTPNAMAVQTLGKDMVFRDFAQGAYRMRGIGRGQSVHILIIPEVYDLIRRTCAHLRTTEENTVRGELMKREDTSSTISGGGMGSRTNSIVHHVDVKEAVLGDVTAWLLVNSIRSEHTQHNQLCIQNIANVWRKEAYAVLNAAHTAGSFTRKALTVDNVHKRSIVDDRTLEGLRVFREPQEYGVAAIVPQPRMFSESLQVMADANTAFITSENGKTVVYGILGLAKREDEIDNPTIDVQMVQEQEEEKENVHEIEKTQQIELEKFVDMTYSRADEAPTPWATDSLADFSLAQAQFYALSNFHLYKRKPIQFPDGVMFSRNFFNPKWTGHRRIKNVVVSMEWTPDIGATIVRKAPSIDFAAVSSAEVNEKLVSILVLLGELKHLAQATKSNADVISAEDAQALVSLALGEAISPEQFQTALTACGYGAVTPQLSADQLVHVLQSNHFRAEESGRYTIALSLAEAETVRRIIHIRRLRNEPTFLPNTNVAIALNIIPAGNIRLDQTANFAETRTPFQGNRAVQCLRFVDGDLNYSELEINLLIRSIFCASTRARQEFFLQMLSCRRRARQRWEKAPVSLAFSIETPLNLLRQKALGLALRKGLEGADLHVADAFLAINNSHSGQLSADEVWGAFRFIGLDTVTADDVLDFIRVADTHHNNAIHYTDFLFMVTGDREVEEDERDSNRKITPIEPYGLDLLGEAKRRRDELQRDAGAEASKDQAAEERRVLEEIERETVMEELALIQRSKNPHLAIQESALTFTFNSRELPNLADFYSTIRNGTGAASNVPSDAFSGTKFWTFADDSTAVLNMRSMQFIANRKTNPSGQMITSNGDKEDESAQDAVVDLTAQPTMNTFALTFEFQVPSVTHTIRGKAWKQGVLHWAEKHAAERLELASYMTNFFEFGSRRSTATRDADEEDEENQEDESEYESSMGSGDSSDSSDADYEDDTDAGSNSDGDSSKASSVGSSEQWMSPSERARHRAKKAKRKFMKCVNFVHKEPNVDKEYRTHRMSTVSYRVVVQEELGMRAATTVGDHQIEWMKIRTPVEGYVILSLNGYTNWNRHKLTFKLHHNGNLNLCSDFDEALTEDVKTYLDPTQFKPVRASGDDDGQDGEHAAEVDSDFDDAFDYNLFSMGGGAGGFGSYDDDEGSNYSDEEGEDEDDEDDGDERVNNAAFDMDLADLMEAVKQARAMKVGDLVQRNPDSWNDGNNDGGPGSTGRVLNVKNNGESIEVAWPTGKKSTYSAEANGKYCVIKVGHESVQELSTNRETFNQDRFENLLMAKAARNCNNCSTQVNTEVTGWYQCNSCNNYALCFTCFANNEHLHHQFTNMTELAEVLRLTKIIIGTCVREPKATTATYGVVNAINVGSNVVSVSFPEEEDLPEQQWKMKGLIIVDVKSEKYSTTYMGTLMNVVGMSKDPKKSAMACVMNQFFAPAIVESKYKIGSQVYVSTNKNRFAVGEVRSALPGGLYSIALPNGELQQKVPEGRLSKAEVVIGDKVRYCRRPDSEHKRVPGVEENSLGTIKNIHLTSLTTGNVAVTLRSGLRYVLQQASLNEVIVVGEGKWYVDERTIPGYVADASTEEPTTAAVPVPEAGAAAPISKHLQLLPKSAQTALERHFHLGSAHADLYLRQVGNAPNSEGNYRVSFNNMMLNTVQKQDEGADSQPAAAGASASVRGATEAVVSYAAVQRDPPLPWVKMAEKGNVDDGKWHVYSILVNGIEPAIASDAVAEEVVGLCDGKKVILDCEGYGFDDDVDSEDEEDEEQETSDEDGSDEAGSDEAGSDEDEQCAKPSGESDESDEGSDNSEGSDVEPVSKKKVPARKTAAKRRDDEDDDDDDYEDITGSDDNDEDADEDADEEHDEDADGSSEGSGEEGEEGSDEKPSNASGEDAEEKSATEDEDKASADKEGGDADADAGAKAAKTPKVKVVVADIPRFKPTTKELLALDLRNPLSVFRFDTDETSNSSPAIFGPDFPERNIASLQLKWGDGVSVAYAKETFEKMDASARWPCKKCGHGNSRLADVCASCGTEKVEDATAKVGKKSKVRAANPNSREVTELKSKMHARMRAQFQKQLDEMDELNAYI